MRLESSIRHRLEQAHIEHEKRAEGDVRDFAYRIGFIEALEWVLEEGDATMTGWDVMNDPQVEYPHPHKQKTSA